MTKIISKYLAYLFFICTLLPFCNGHEFKTDFHVFLQGDLSEETAKGLSAGKTFPCRPVRVKADDNFVDFSKWNDGKFKYRQPGILLARIDADKDGLRYIGIGADWYFSCYLNGEAVYLPPSGNLLPVARENYQIPVKVKAGKNLFAIRVLAGSKGWGTYCTLSQGPDVKLPHPPWLVKSDIGTATVNFITSSPMSAFLEYRPAGSTQWKRLKNSTAGLLRQTKLHSFELKDLQEDTVYEFRAVLAPDRHFGYEYNSGIYTFRSFGKNNRKFRIFLTGDTQVARPDRIKVFQDFKKNTPLDSCDAFIHLGDADNFIGNAEDLFFNSILDIVQANRKSLPHLVMVRGNHEYLGKDALTFIDYFCGKDGKTHYSFRQGKVFFIVLDNGCDHAYEVRKNHAFYAYLDDENIHAEQQEFLKRTVRSKDFQEAEFRIVISHSPGINPCRMTDSLKKICEGVFPGDPVKNKIHLWISGHTHKYCRTVNKNTTAQRAFTTEGLLRYTAIPNTIHLVNDGPFVGNGLDISAILMEFTPGKIEVKAFDPAGKVFDHFNIDANGELKEIHTNLQVFGL